MQVFHLVNGVEKLRVNYLETISYLKNWKRSSMKILKLKNAILNLIVMSYILGTATGCTTSPEMSASEPIFMSIKSKLAYQDVLAITTHNESVGK